MSSLKGVVNCQVFLQYYQKKSTFVADSQGGLRINVGLSVAVSSLHIDLCLFIRSAVALRPLRSSLGAVVAAASTRISIQQMYPLCSMLFAIQVIVIRCRLLLMPL